MHVERDTFAAALVAASLEDAGIDVRQVADGEAALAAAAEQDFDAYVVGADRDTGAQASALAERLRDATPEVPLVLVAADPDPSCDAETIVREPFRQGELEAAVDTALSSRACVRR
jgi:DNA-binding response OmpR family regulator